MSTTTMRSLYAFLCLLFVNGIWAAAPPPELHPSLYVINASFSFTESAIATQPGETIQICIDKYGNGTTWNTTIIVNPIGNKNPHLSGFSGQSLTFSGNTTQACFDLTIGSDQSSQSYTLGIQGSTEEMEIDVDHQVMGFCGVITKPVNTPSPNSSPTPIDFWDRFGNAYAYDELLFNVGNMECTDSGRFALEFAGSFTPAEISTICSVFDYLSTLIGTSATDIPIFIIKDPLPNSILAAGTEFYRANTEGGCGIENSTIWEFINTDIYSSGLFENDIVVGEIQISDSTNWHTLDMDGPTEPEVDSDFFDMYSVVLHEALHILGFASRITADGTPLNGFYTAWDRELIMGMDPNGMAIPALTPVTSTQCCDAHEYNTALSDPDPTTFSCSNSFEFPFDANMQQATVWGEYGPTVVFPSQNAFVINVLSHLNGDCDLVDYVMVAEFLAGTDNRFVTAEEQGILCQLGYQIMNGGTLACSGACTVVAVNDFVFIPFEEVEIAPNEEYSVEIDYSALTTNDFFPSGATVDFYTCDPVVNVTITNNPSMETFTVSGFVSGQAFTLCYSASGCDGICDDATVNVVIELSEDQILIGSGPGCGEQENIVGWGTFEDFTVFPNTGNSNVALNSYFSQTSLEECDPIGVNSLGMNTPGILSDNNGNTFAYMGGTNLAVTVNNESIVLPLSQPIFPGCSIILEFDIHSENHSMDDYSFLEFYGSFYAPCDASVFDGSCSTSQSENDVFCIMTDGDGIHVMEDFEILTPEGHFSYPWTNEGDTQINYLIAINNTFGYGQLTDWIPASGDNSGPLEFGIDNVSVIQNCDNELSITSEVQSSCEGESVIIDYTVCLTGADIGERDVELTLGLPTLPGVVFGSGDFTSNELVLEDMLPNGDCQMVRLILDFTGSPLEAGDIFTVQLEGVAPGACIDDPNLTEVTLEDCTSCLPILTGYTFIRDCANGELTFTADVSDGIHSWIINGVTHQGNPLAIPINDLTEDEIYTVEHVVLNECSEVFSSGEADILIEACLTCDPIQAGFTTTQDCTNGTVTFTAIDPAGTHSWLIEGNVETGTSVTIPITEPTMNDFYSVEHTVTNNCGETDTDFDPKFPVPACASPLICPCTGPNAVNIDAGAGTFWQNTPLAALAVADDVSPNFIDLSNLCVTITGRLRIGPDVMTQGAQSDLALSFGALRMQPDAEIVIEDDASLRLFAINEADDQGSGLHGCKFMWQGITVETGGELKMIDTHIQDAVVAVQAFPDATLDIYDNDFVDNNVGLDIIGAINTDPPGTVNVGINGIERNLFDGMTGLLGTSDNSIPLGAIPEIGVRLTEVSWLAIGSFNGEGNFFRGLQHGVESSGSNYAFVQADMQDIIESGINSMEEDFVFLYRSKMERMPLGIDIKAGSISASGNELSQISNTGIRLFGAGSMDLTVIDISNHTIEADGFGIDLVSTLDDNNLYIQGNRIVLTPLPAGTATYQERAAFRMLNQGADGAGFNDQARIRNNDIIVQGAGIGVDIMNIGNIDLHYNDIAFYNPVEMIDGVYRGISLVNSDNNYLYDNETKVGNISSDFNELVGYYFAACQATRLCCNSSDRGFIGFEFAENCMDTEWRTSEINDHQIGLRINEASLIGRQKYAGNRWEGSYVEGAEHLSTSPFLIGLSRFIISPPMMPPFWPPTPAATPNAPGADWFEEGDNTGNALCGSDALCLPVPPPFNGIIKETDRFLADTTYQGTPYESFHDWEGRKFLMAKLNANATYWQGDQQLQQFYNNHTGSLLEDYLDLNEQMKTVFQGQPAQTLVRLDALKAHLASLKNLETQYLNATTDIERADLQDDYADANADLDTELGQLKALQSTAKTNRETAATNLIAANNALTTPDIFTTNQQSVNGFQLALWSGLLPVLGSGQISKLEQIAYQCPLEGGNAVHRARAMLRGINEYNFEGVNCVSTQALRGQNSTPTQANDDKLANTPAAVDPAVWRIYPNPASNYLRIIGNHLEELHSVNLYDLSGKLQQTWSGGNSGNNYQLSDNLSAGIYILRLYLADGTQVNRKLVINQ